MDFYGQVRLPLAYFIDKEEKTIIHSLKHKIMLRLNHFFILLIISIYSLFSYGTAFAQIGIVEDFDSVMTITLTGDEISTAGKFKQGIYSI